MNRNPFYHVVIVARFVGFCILWLTLVAVTIGVPLFILVKAVKWFWNL